MNRKRNERQRVPGVTRVNPPSRSIGVVLSAVGAASAGPTVRQSNLALRQLATDSEFRIAGGTACLTVERREAQSQLAEVEKPVDPA